MDVLLVLGVISLAAASAGVDTNSHDQVVSCYVGSWAVYRPSKGRFTIEDINPFLCTHMIYAFAGLDELTYTIRALDPEYDINKEAYKRFVALKKKNPKLKTLLAVGGWTEGSEKYSKMANNPDYRKAFVNSAVEFLRQYGFDGLDLDWEYPANRGGIPADKENFVNLVKELKSAFKEHGLILTAAVGAGKNVIDSAYDVRKLSKYLNYIHLMAYDYHGKWDGRTGHNAPLYARADESEIEQQLNVNFSARYYLSLGAPRHKFILGLGLYGRTFLLQDSKNPGIGAPARKSAFAGPYTREDGFLGYNEICEKQLAEQGSWSVAWQNAHQAPYMFKDNMWVGFDDPNSLGLKVTFAQRLGLAGVMAWSVDTDDFSGQCGQPYPLLRAINTNLVSFKDSRPDDSHDVPDTREPEDTKEFDLDLDEGNNNALERSRYYPIELHSEGNSVVSNFVALILSALSALMLAL